MNATVPGLPRAQADWRFAAELSLALAFALAAFGIRVQEFGSPAPVPGS